MRKNSGTMSRVCAIISGDLADSGIRILDDGKKKVRVRNNELKIINE